MSEQIAKQFHEAYERLAPSFSYETRERSRKPWEEVPENNRRLMIAVTDEVCGNLEAQLAAERERREHQRQKTEVLAWELREHLQILHRVFHDLSYNGDLLDPNGTCKICQLLARPDVQELLAQKEREA